MGDPYQTVAMAGASVSTTDVRSMHVGTLFTAPWPGPGNSEGPVDPELPVTPTANTQVDTGKTRESIPHLQVMTDAWPGPGDSEGPVETGAEEPSE